VHYVYFVILAMQFIEVNEMCIDIENQSDSYGTADETLLIVSNNN